MNLLIGRIQESSTVDYPGEFVSVIFFCQCVFRCPFCQNWGLVLAEDCMDRRVEDVITQLEGYRKYITGVCVTGGEPTIQFEGLMELLKNTQRLGLLNKLDTNGFYSNRIKHLMDLQLLNYIALDIKAPLEPDLYGNIIGKPSLGEKAVSKIILTLKHLMNSALPFETRTTIIPNCNDSEQDIENIGKKLKEFNVSKYVLQQFRTLGGTLAKDFSEIPMTPYENLVKLAKIASEYIPDVRIRTIEAGEEKIQSLF